MGPEGCSPPGCRASLESDRPQPGLPGDLQRGPAVRGVGARRGGPWYQAWLSCFLAV